MFGVFGEFYVFPWAAAFIRPFYIVASIGLLRDYWWRYLLVMAESLPMVIFIIVYVLYFSWMGMCLFSGTLEGTTYFNNYANSVFNMLVLLTTSNFPDIMLPAYQISRLYGIFFISFLLVGLFLVMNLLLAILYSNYKAKFEQGIIKTSHVRLDYFYGRFNIYGEKREFLTQNETYLLFMDIHSLVKRDDKIIFLSQCEVAEKGNSMKTMLQSSAGAFSLNSSSENNLDLTLS
jgi:hypothetical protein